MGLNQALEEIRPCFYDGGKYIFHTFVNDRNEALLEGDSGAVKIVPADSIRFADTNWTDFSKFLTVKFQDSAVKCFLSDNRYKPTTAIFDHKDLIPYVKSAMKKYNIPFYFGENEPSVNETKDMEWANRVNCALSYPVTHQNYFNDCCTLETELRDAFTSLNEKVPPKDTRLCVLFVNGSKENDVLGDLNTVFHGYRFWHIDDDGNRREYADNEEVKLWIVYTGA